MAGQTINDRLLAARHSIAGQGLAKSVCKATTEEMIGPKKKHLDYLVQCTNEPNVSIPQLANLLVERSQNANWIVVYKALITVHHMMCYGNERFTQFLASSNSTFQLSNYLDKSGLQGVAGAKAGYDMSPFVRRYARYLNEKALSYRTVAFDFCKIKRGKEDGTLRTMNAEKLLKTLPTLQNQLDALLEFDCTANNLNNGVINMCFMLLFRDLIRLFACYNDGVINLLEKYFDMNKKQCRDALDLYKRFLIRMDKVAEFLKVAENVGIDKGDIPDLTKAPSSLLDALEQHLLAIEGKKSNTTTPTQSANNQRNIRSGVTALSSTSTAFGTAASNGRLDGTNGIDESLKQQVLAEEEAAMNQYKSKVHSPNSSTNPFLSSLSNAAPTPALAVDLFGPPILKHEPSFNKASDDLLQLSNPFADVFAQPAPVTNVPIQQNIWLTNGNGFAPQPAPPQTNTTFVSESNFSSVFGTTETSAANDLNVSGSPALNPFLTDISTNEVPSPFFLEDDPSPEPPMQQQAMFDLFASDINNESCKLDSVLPLTQTTPNIYPQQNQQIYTPTGIPIENQNYNNQDDEMMFDMTDDTNKKIDIENVMTPCDSDFTNKTVMAAFESNLTNDTIMSPRDLTSSLMAAHDLSTTTMTASHVSNLTTETVMASSNQINAVDMVTRKIVPPPRPPPPVVKQAQPPAKSALLDDLSTQSFLMALGSPECDNTMGGSLLGDQPSVLEPALQPQTCLQDNMPFAGFDGLGGVLQPASSQGSVISNNSKSAQAQSSALLTGDLESSLASLAENLSINSRPVAVKGVQWNSPKNGAKPGASWTPQPMAATTGAGYRPMGQGMPNLSQQPMFPSIQPMGIRPMSAGTGIMTPMTGMGPSPATNPPMAQQQSLLFH